MLFPQQANGSLIQNERGQVIGSRLVGQGFSQPQYFHPRPSSPGYDAANSGGFNQGATNAKFIARLKADTETYRLQNEPKNGIPADAVTASASGLDPHISVKNALIQAKRVAHARKLTMDSLVHLIQAHTENSALGDGAYVNVLALNLALDHKLTSIGE